MKRLAGAGVELPRPNALVFAAGMLFLSSSTFASTPIPVIDYSHPAAPVGETVTDDTVKGSDADDVLAGHSPLTLAVNGRVVATHDEPASVTANKWNWTLLVLGCAGLVVS